MRLGWEAAGSHMPPLPRSASPSPSPSSSAFPIDVDGDSDDSDEADAAMAATTTTATAPTTALPGDSISTGSLSSPPVRVPVISSVRMPVRLPVRTSAMPMSAQAYPTLRLSARAKRPLKYSLDGASAGLRQQSSSDESEDEKQRITSVRGDVDQELKADEEVTNRMRSRATPFPFPTLTPAANKRPSKPPLNFFFNTSECVSPSQPRRERYQHRLASSAGRHRPDSSRSSSARSSPTREAATCDVPLQPLIFAARTCICGQLYGRCELTFLADQVKVLLWHLKSRMWEGFIEYSQLARFCFSRGEGPPYVLLLELNPSQGHSEFSAFYDAIYAQVEQLNKQDDSLPHLYGIVFYFDKQMDYVRCQSVGENNPRLAHLFAQQLARTEMQQYLKWDVAQQQKLKLRRGDSALAGSSGRERSLASIVGSGAKQAIESVSSFFRQRVPRPMLETALDDDRGSLAVSSQRSVNSLSLAGERYGTSVASAPSSPRNKRLIQLDKDGQSIDTNRQEKRGKTEDGVETVVLIPSQQQEPLDVSTEALTDESLASLGTEQERQKESKKRKASQRQDEEIKAKRQKLESRRNEVLVSYPYEDAEVVGRISVTLGDIDRLAPGEFLNDNIIDFYLRFLWRHLDPWQQQQMYFFSSHFFTQLNGTNGAYELSVANPEERFKRVARWTHKETNLFDKRFLFIPINDSFHWSIAVFCNPGSAIIKKCRRKVRQSCRRRRTFANGTNRAEVVDLVDNPSYLSENGKSDESGDGAAASNVYRSALGAVEADDCHIKMESEGEAEVEEEEVASCQKERLANPPCLLFLDSLRCHRKKKFTKMLRDYLECEWKVRFASSADSPSHEDDTRAGAERSNGQDDKQAETLVTSFDPESIKLLEPNVPLQSNSSDCGVFLLMYAAAIVRSFPAGITREDLDSHLSSTLTPGMFGDEHVLEFRDYLRQLLFCLKQLQQRGLDEMYVRHEDLEEFAIE